MNYSNRKGGSSGSPILNLSTNKVIGIHIGHSKDFYFNIWNFLNEPIKNFIELYKSKDSQRKNSNKFFKEEDDKNLNFISNKINSII